MKKYKKVNQDRIEKHKDLDRNTIHRSSLMVSEIDKSKNMVLLHIQYHII